MAKEVKKEVKMEKIVISSPNFMHAAFHIRGKTPLVMNRFTDIDFKDMEDKQKAGHVSRSKKMRKPKNFDARYEQSMHRSTDGWAGIPSLAFRAGMISVCRLVGYKMTVAKLAISVEPDGFEEDGTPLVRITSGEPRQVRHVASNSNKSTDIRARAMWNPGWEAVVRVTWDSDQFALEDVTNLLHRVGLQGGILAGRPDSKNSPGMGWGLFDIVND